MKIKQVFCKHKFKHEKILISVSVPFSVVEKLRDDPINIDEYCIFENRKVCLKCGLIKI